MASLGILLLLLFAIGIAYYRSLAFFPFALGAALGVAASALKVVMLDRAIKKAVKMEATAAGNYIGIQNFLRLLLTGLALVLSAVLPFINIWGAAAGVISLQVALYFVKNSGNREEKETKSENVSQSGGD